MDPFWVHFTCIVQFNVTIILLHSLCLTHENLTRPLVEWNGAPFAKQLKWMPVSMTSVCKFNHNPTSSIINSRLSVLTWYYDNITYTSLVFWISVLNNWPQVGRFSFILGQGRFKLTSRWAFSSVHGLQLVRVGLPLLHLICSIEPYIFLPWSGFIDRSFHSRSVEWLWAHIILFKHVVRFVSGPIRD